ncbi:hypothetical protein NIES4073_81420 [Kalymmatonema gypsitolerans NIES-4073]|nr:hypothetical protein NIES4073_81420 [Scytonema sp. NIES-4073]
MKLLSPVFGTQVSQLFIPGSIPNALDLSQIIQKNLNLHHFLQNSLVHKVRSREFENQLSGMLN